MQTKTWKFIAIGLVLVVLILCMMTFYLNGSNRNFEVQLNRMDREKAEMQRDYEKLYSAYYSYDKKILKILEGNPNVIWAKDSSAYTIINSNKILFSFYKKPRMEKEVHLFRSIQLKENSRWLNIDEGRIDTLKPHQLKSISMPVPNKLIVAEMWREMPAENLILEITLK